MEKKILLVDDDIFVLDCVSDLLSEHGFKVTIAINGKDGLHKLEAREFDLVVTDIKMPVLDGVGFYLLALKDYPYLRNRFLFMTSHHHESPKTFPFDEMDLNFISKPFMLEEFIKRIKILTSLS